MLFDGPWIAERYAALSPFVNDHRNDLLDVTRSVLQTADQYFFVFQAEDVIRDYKVTGVQTCALPISEPWDFTEDRRLKTVLCGAQKIANSGNADRKSTRLNSSHLVTSYAVFCLK